ncbi:MAG: carboxylesterase family protein, partial [Bacteroidales bacterium]|nr:carboxylesterase family protein [Bacteroidales bacterium]
MRRQLLTAAVAATLLASCGQQEVQQQADKARQEAEAAARPVLTIEGGQVQGVPTETANVVVFRGIPYAAPPIGDLRWKEPQPVV